MRSVIVGGGVAGISAAMDVARRGLGEVIVLSDETYPYYYRPQLTEFLAGNLSLERLIRRPLSWYQERGIDVRLGTRAARLLPDAKSVVLKVAMRSATTDCSSQWAVFPSSLRYRGGQTGVYTWKYSRTRWRWRRWHHVPGYHRGRWRPAGPGACSRPSQVLLEHHRA